MADPNIRMIKKINYIKFLYTMLQYRTSQNEF